MRKNNIIVYTGKKDRESQKSIYRQSSGDSSAVGDLPAKKEKGTPRKRRQEKLKKEKPIRAGAPASAGAPTAPSASPGKRPARPRRTYKALIAVAVCAAIVIGSAGGYWGVKAAERKQQALTDSIVPTDVEASIDLQFVPKVPAILPRLDFAALATNETNATLKSMHEYFGGRPATFTNEYTGMFKGYNFIQIIAEAFSPWILALEPQLYPNLNRLYHEGFQFTNFYTPYYYQSTSDGEYVTLQSQIPVTGHWYTGHNSMIMSAKNYLPQTMAHQLANEGYSIITAYHNWNYSFYRRNESHPNLGYKWVAMGSGLSIPYSWPTSDVDLMKASIPEYINSGEPFHIYYLTMSGHQNYNWGGNNMCARHRSEVADLPYAEVVKAYLACNIELDLAVGYLLDELEKAGIADRTLISLTPDHYPYGLDNDGAGGMSLLAGRKLDTVFEYYESGWLLWSGSMTEPIVVDTLACCMDTLPTLNNLLGVKWDSRLLMGQDVFSDAERLVIFGSHSWMTELGRYNASARKFTPNEGAVIPDGYAEKITAAVERAFVMSRQILTNNYFKVIYTKSNLI